MAHAHTSQHLSYLSGRALTPTVSVFLACVVVMAKWSERRRSRKALADLDPHLLKDIGLTPSEAHREATRPFWRI